MLDMHVHVWRHDEKTSDPTLDQISSYCDAALAAGVEVIAFTEHCHRFTRIADEVLPQWQRRRSGAMASAADALLAHESGGDLDKYVTVLEQAQDRGMPVLIGLEVDYLPGCLEPMESVLSDYPFDVLLGSVHWLDDWLFDAYGIEAFAAAWRTRDTNDVWTTYVDAVAELAASGLVDVLAHVDVIKVAGYRPADETAHWARLVSALSSSDVVVEVSTAGLFKPVSELYPAPGLLDRLTEAGVGVTTASDAHQVEHVGRSFDSARHELERRGITKLATFSRRRRLSYEL